MLRRLWCPSTDLRAPLRADTVPIEESLQKDLPVLPFVTSEAERMYGPTVFGCERPEYAGVSVAVNVDPGLVEYSGTVPAH